MLIMCQTKNHHAVDHMFQMRIVIFFWKTLKVKACQVEESTKLGLAQQFFKPVCGCIKKNKRWK